MLTTRLPLRLYAIYVDRLQTEMNQAYVDLDMWFKACGLRLNNEEKSKVMLFSLTHHYPTIFSANLKKTPLFTLLFRLQGLGLVRISTK